MPILRTLKNYLKAYIAKGVIRFMSEERKIVYISFSNPVAERPAIVGGNVAEFPRSFYGRG